MKRFLKHIFFFIIPFIAGILLVFMAPYSKEFAYGFRNNVDCNTSWIYYRLYNNPTPIDVAFIGTSHTGCGINDSLIENSLKNEYQVEKNISNLAYCTNGRNIQYPLLQDLLINKKPELIIIEVTENESTNSHQDFPYLADVDEILEPRLNLSYITDIWEALTSRFMYLRQYYTKTISTKIPLNVQFKHSYVPFHFFADKEALKNRKADLVEKEKKYNPTILNDISAKYPKNELKKMIKLCRDNEVKVVFLYIPSYGTSLIQPRQYHFYKNYGEVWIAPNSIFENTNNWVDGEHLNANGSSQLGAWLTKKISAL